jgi:hypothetical protein
MRVIFDRSAFHGERFRVLQKSRLGQLVRHGAIQVYHTPIFIEETIAAFGSQGAAGEWREHLAFALDICNGGFFLEKQEIWQEEIVRGHRATAMRLLPARRNRYGSASDLKKRLRELVRNGDLSAEWQGTEQDRDESHRKKIEQRRIAGLMRRDIEAARRDGRLLMPLDAARFEDTISQDLVFAGRLLMRHVDEVRCKVLAEKWATRPMEYPFYTAFVEGFLYHQFHALIKHNKKIDSNAQGDYEQLIYLLWADVFVSNDITFLRDAFNEIWAPRGKRLETAESFAALLENPPV